MTSTAPVDYTPDMRTMYNLLFGMGSAEADNYFHTAVRTSNTRITDEQIVAFFERKGNPMEHGQFRLYKIVAEWADTLGIPMSTNLLVAGRKGLIDGFREEMRHFIHSPDAYSGYRDIMGEYSDKDLKRYGFK